MLVCIIWKGKGDLFITAERLERGKENEKRQKRL